MALLEERRSGGPEQSSEGENKYLAVLRQILIILVSCER